MAGAGARHPTAAAIHYSSGLTGPRSFLTVERRRFARSRRSREPAVGRVGRRFLRCRSAPRTSSAKRSTTVSRLRCWLREPSSVSRSTPASLMRLASRARMRPRCSSERVGEEATSHSSSMRVEEVLTCCPPGPPERLARSRSSRRGIASESSISMALADSDQSATTFCTTMSNLTVELGGTITSPAALRPSLSPKASSGGMISVR